MRGKFCKLSASAMLMTLAALLEQLANILRESYARALAGPCDDEHPANEGCESQLGLSTVHACTKRGK